MPRGGLEDDREVRSLVLRAPADGHIRARTHEVACKKCTGVLQYEIIYLTYHPMFEDDKTHKGSLEEWGKTSAELRRISHQSFHSLPFFLSPSPDLLAFPGLRLACLPPLHLTIVHLSTSKPIDLPSAKKRSFVAFLR